MTLNIERVHNRSIWNFIQALELSKSDDDYPLELFDALIPEEAVDDAHFDFNAQRRFLKAGGES